MNPRGPVKDQRAHDLHRGLLGVDGGCIVEERPTFFAPSVLHVLGMVAHRIPSAAPERLIIDGIDQQLHRAIAAWASHGFLPQKGNSSSGSSCLVGLETLAALTGPSVSPFPARCMSE